MRVALRGSLVVALTLCWSVPAGAQTPKSAPLAKELVAALQSGNLTAVAAKDSASSDVFIGALHIPGVQLLVVSAQYTAPQLLESRIAKQEYRDVYVDLNAAGTPDSRVFVEDSNADGLLARPDDGRADSYEAEGRRTVFNREWRDQQLSEEEYLAIYATADEQYAAMLEALLAQLKNAH